MTSPDRYVVVPFPPQIIKRPYGWLMRRLRPCLYLAHVSTRPLLDEKRFSIPDGIDVRYATSEELHQACRRDDMLLDAARVDASLTRGDVCSAAYDGAELVGYAWNAFTRAPHTDGIWVEFRAPYRYGYKSFVHPDYRGRRISNGMAVHADADCINRGFSHAISFVETHNYKSIQSSRRHFGREFVGFAGYLRCAGRVFPFRSPAVKKLGFRFVPPDEVAGTDMDLPAGPNFRSG